MTFYQPPDDRGDIASFTSGSTLTDGCPTPSTGLPPASELDSGMGQPNPSDAPSLFEQLTPMVLDLRKVLQGLEGFLSSNCLSSGPPSQAYVGPALQGLSSGPSLNSPTSQSFSQRHGYSVDGSGHLNEGIGRTITDLVNATGYDRGEMLHLLRGLHCQMVVPDPERDPNGSLGWPGEAGKLLPALDAFVFNAPSQLFQRARSYEGSQESTTPKASSSPPGRDYPLQGGWSRQ